MGRSPCCAKEGLNRGSWSVREDQILSNYISVHGEGKWRDLPQRAGLKRCGKSCRLRWLNYLKPDIKRGNISVEEEDLIIKLHQLLGNRWALIAGRLPGRTDNEIKNYWNTNLSKRVEDRHKSQDSPKKQDNKNKKKELTEKFSSLGSGQLKEVVEPHQVIRTKATRCTRVIIPQHLHNNNNNNNNNNNMVTTKKKLVPKNNSHDTTSQFSSPAPDDDVSSNFLMDFDIGELFISDILDSDIFHDKVNDNHDRDGENENHAFDDENKNNTSSNDSAPCDQGMLDESTNEMSFLENWKANDDDDDDDQQPLQLNEALELKKLANFFNLDELDEK